MHILKRMPTLKIFNLGLRGVSLGGKFLLIFLLARFLMPEELGLYGLLAVAISYSLYLLGFDYYTYSTRELVSRGEQGWGQVLKSQSALFCTLYAVVLPILSLAFYFGVLPIRLIGWFFVLVIIEHMNQELFRLFVAISQPLKASIVLCFRSGLWAIAIVLIMIFMPSARTLDAVLIAWLIGGVIALGLSLRWLYAMRIQGWQSEVDWMWIRNGLRVAGPLLIATLALRGLSTFDRYWFEYILGLENLGAYVLFTGVCSALIAFLDAGVFSFIYPLLIKAWHQNDHISFSTLMRKMLWQTVLLVLFFSILCELSIAYLVSWLDKPIYLQSMDLFPWILAGNVFFALGLIPHYGLYAQRQDRPIIVSHIAALGIFVASTIALSEIQPRLAVPISTAIAFLSILCWKTWCYCQVTPAQFRSIKSIS